MERPETDAMDDSFLKIWKTYTKIILILALPLIDLFTDIYTLNLYYEPNKSFMVKAFCASLFVISLHNVISTACGVTRISALHSRSKLVIWGSNGWKFVTVALHAIGVGGILVPLEAILSTQKLNPETIYER